MDKSENWYELDLYSNGMEKRVFIGKDFNKFMQYLNILYNSSLSNVVIKTYSGFSDLFNKQIFIVHFKESGENMTEYRIYVNDKLYETFLDFSSFIGRVINCTYT